MERSTGSSDAIVGSGYGKGNSSSFWAKYGTDVGGPTASEVNGRPWPEVTPSGDAVLLDPDDQSESEDA